MLSPYLITVCGLGKGYHIWLGKEKKKREQGADPCVVDSSGGAERLFFLIFLWVFFACAGGSVLQVLAVGCAWGASSCEPELLSLLK